MTTQRLLIPDFVPTSANRLYRGTRRDRIRLAKGDKQLVAHFAREQGLTAATTPRRVSIAVTVARGCGPDPDNVLKGLLDALVACRLIVDDDAMHLSLGEITVTRGDRRETVVTLEDLPPLPVKRVRRGKKGGVTR